MSTIIRGKKYESLKYWNDNTGIDNIFQYPKSLFNIETSTTMFNYFLTLYPNRLVNCPFDENYNEGITKMLNDITSLTIINTYKINQWIKSTELIYDPINPYHLESTKTGESNDNITENNTKDDNKHMTGTQDVTGKSTLTLDTSTSDNGTNTQSTNERLEGTDNTDIHNVAEQSTNSTTGVSTYDDENFFNSDHIAGTINKTENTTNTKTYGKTNNKDVTNTLNTTQTQTGTNTQDVTQKNTNDSTTTGKTTENNQITKENNISVTLTEKGNKWNYLYSQMIQGERNLSNFSPLKNFFELVAEYILLPIYEEEY